MLKFNIYFFCRVPKIRKSFCWVKHSNLIRASIAVLTFYLLLYYLILNCFNVLVHYYCIWGFIQVKIFYISLAFHIVLRVLDHIHDLIYLHNISADNNTNYESIVRFQNLFLCISINSPFGLC